MHSLEFTITGDQKLNDKVPLEYGESVPSFANLRFQHNGPRVKVVMKEQSVLPALIEVLDGGWDFTVSVAVARKEDGMQVREMDESTQHLAEAHTGTVGKKREEEDRSTVGKGTRLGQLAEQWSGEVVKRLRMLPGGHVERTGGQWETVGLQRLSVQI